MIAVGARELRKNFANSCGVYFMPEIKYGMLEYLGSGRISALKSSGRMLLLGADYTKDAFELAEQSMSGSHDIALAHSLGRYATCVEMHASTLLVIAAEHSSANPMLQHLPTSLRESLKTISLCRDYICNLGAEMSSLVYRQAS